MVGRLLMKRRWLVSAAALGGLTAALGAGCGDSAKPGPAAGLQPADGVYAINLMVASLSSRPVCTDSLSGDVVYVSSPSSLWACRDHNWFPVTCSVSNVGDVA